MEATMGSTRWRCARLSLIRDDSELTEAARHGDIWFLHSVEVRPWQVLAPALLLQNRNEAG
jgi:hypothetical protein